MAIARRQRELAGGSEQLYEAANFGGSQTPIAQSMSSVGPAMNDRASSIRWF